MAFLLCKASHRRSHGLCQPQRSQERLPGRNHRPCPLCLAEAGNLELYEGLFRSIIIALPFRTYLSVLTLLKIYYLTALAAITKGL